jgi:6-phosphogluconolactonase
MRPYATLEEVASETLPLISRGAVAVSGGSTYAALFPLWAALEPVCPGVSFWPVDERVVPFGDPASNWGTADSLLLQPLGRGADAAHFARSAAEFEEALHAELGTPPCFDCVFLGVGSDGHTASLFPGGSYLHDRSSDVLSTQSPKPPTERISLAPRVLTGARHLVAVVAGQEKAGVVRGMLQGDLDLPIVRILVEHPSPVVYVERSLMPVSGAGVSRS